MQPKYEIGVTFKVAKLSFVFAGKEQIYNFEIRAKIISIFPGCMVEFVTKIKYFKKRKPGREQ